MSEEKKFDQYPDLKVMLLDDDTRNLMLISRFVGAYGVHIIAGETLSEGLEKLAEKPDVVISDLAMPNLPSEMGTYDKYAGIRLANKLLEDEETRIVPLIILTANVVDQFGKNQMAEIKGKIAAPQRETYVLSKPYDIDELKSILDRILMSVNNRKQQNSTL